MSKLSLIGRIRDVYRRGGNVLHFLKDGDGSSNDWESIMISYDFQAGSYTKMAAETVDYTDRYTDLIAGVMGGLGEYASIMEVGVGEATIMNPLMAKLDPAGALDAYGFDISWSRTRYARANADEAGRDTTLFVANLFEIPLPDNAIDIVYTSHSLEPNGGKEREALAELYRVARRYVVLLEPDFDSASPEGHERMAGHGYVRDLAGHARALGYDVAESRPFGESINPLNPTGLTVIRKTPTAEPVAPGFVCPVTHTPLTRHEGVLYGEESGLMYPVIDGLPCLIESSAVLGLHFGHFNRAG